MKLGAIISSLLVSSAIASELFNPEELTAANVCSIMRGQYNGPLSVQDLVDNRYMLGPEHLHLLEFDELKMLIKAITHGGHFPFIQFEMIPAKFFKISDNIYSFLKLSDVKDIDEFVGLLTPKQFKEFVAIANNFPEVSVEALNTLHKVAINVGEAHKLRKYMKYVTPAFLDLIFDPCPPGIWQSHPVGPLERSVIELLPETFLNEIVHRPHVDDGQYWTKEQLGHYNANRLLLMAHKIPEENMAFITNFEAIGSLIKCSGLTEWQIRNISTEAWNSILSDVEVCERIPAGHKFRDISELNFNAKCFARLHPSIQSHILVNHKNLPEDILSHVTNYSCPRWFFRKSYGLEILKYVHNKSIIKHLGTHMSVDPDWHPLKGMSIDEVRSIKDLNANLTGAMIKAMNLDFPRDLRSFINDADLYCAKRGAAMIIEDLWDEDRESILAQDENAAVEENFWSTLTKEEASKFFGPSYSIVLSEMSKTSFLKFAANKEGFSAVNPVLFNQIKYADELPEELDVIEQVPSVDVKAAPNPVLFNQVKYADELPEKLDVIEKVPSVDVKVAPKEIAPASNAHRIDHLVSQNNINFILFICILILFYRTA